MWLERRHEWLNVRVTSGFRGNRPRDKLRRNFAKLLLLGIFAFWCANLAPSLAAEEAPLGIIGAQTPSPDSPESTQPAPTLAPTVASTPSPTPTPPPSDFSAPPEVTPTPTSSPESSLDPSATPLPLPSASPTEDAMPKIITDQKIVAHIPEVVPVDPRSTSVSLPSLFISHVGILETCLSSPGLVFDVGQKNMADASSSGQLQISGDLTSKLVLSGSASLITSFLSSNGGLRVIKNLTPIAPSIIQISSIALSKQSLDPTFCHKARAENIRSTIIEPFGLTLNLNKGSITLH